MPGFKLAVIVGSLRKDSYNLRFAKSLIKLGEGKFQAEILRIDDLPLYNQDLETDFPTPAQRLKNEIQNNDAVLFVTPEYNRSFPGVLKNAIDWASRPYGKNAFAKKPAGVVGISPGATGTAVSQHALRPTLNYLDMVVLGQPEMYIQFKEGLIEPDGTVNNDKTREFFNSYVTRFAAWVESSGAQKQKTNAAA